MNTPTFCFRYALLSLLTLSAVGCDIGGNGTRTRTILRISRAGNDSDFDYATYKDTHVALLKSPMVLKVAAKRLSDKGYGISMQMLRDDVRVQSDTTELLVVSLPAGWNGAGPTETEHVLNEVVNTFVQQMEASHQGDRLKMLTDLRKQHTQLQPEDVQDSQPDSPSKIAHDSDALKEKLLDLKLKLVELQHLEEASAITSTKKQISYLENQIQLQHKRDQLKSIERQIAELELELEQTPPVQVLQAASTPAAR